jgi:hypothetical protein
LQVLATSREPLALAAERVVPVDPLARSDAVELFLARAEAAGARGLDEDAVARLRMEKRDPSRQPGARRAIDELDPTDREIVELAGAD